ncbi:hypothetical protein K469DRAFT_753060 [Zopfia rhizophila CBS 207.26]|uniref:Uncharacterized protein n=1 Tax=Zopfia rhizophila CBS 207.26 TaxID=1314779 RepID=A0A6A6DRY5_9PEZI|nr:hypothetical protein K469DRAFT_753060 [Zopfia rhizophila CBS 207.26]
MDCKSIGQANPDIAGTGILAAFVVQSLIAVIVSGYTWMLSSEIRRRKKEQEQSEARRNWTTILSQQWRRVLDTLIEDVPFFRAARNAVIGCVPLFYVVKNALYPGYRGVKDWLIGKQLEQSEDGVTPTTKRLDFANRILASGSDAQTFTGIALLISALVQSKNLSLYHMHILYDTNSLVIVSNCAASHWVFRHPSKGPIRLALMTIWAALLVAYMSIFTSRLQKWDADVPFHCYKTALISRPGDPHPLVDNVYIGFTFVYIMASFLYAVKLAILTNAKFREMLPGKQRRAVELTNSRSADNPISEGVAAGMQVWSLAIALMEAHDVAFGGLMDIQYAILTIALVQCPLHIYSIFALRAANERYLEGGSEEAQWGFGQIAAVVLLGGNVLQIVDGVVEYHVKESVKER